MSSNLSVANLHSFNGSGTKMSRLDIDKSSISAPSLSLYSNAKKPPIVPVTESWKDKESLKLMISEALGNRQKFVQILQKLDKEMSHICSVTVFLQSSVDQDINFDLNSISYITKQSNSKGDINYMKLSKNMVIRSVIDCTGSIISGWHIKSALDPG